MGKEESAYVSMRTKCGVCRVRLSIWIDKRWGSFGKIKFKSSNHPDSRGDYNK